MLLYRGEFGGCSKKCESVSEKPTISQKRPAQGHTLAYSTSRCCCLGICKLLHNGVFAGGLSGPADVPLAGAIASCGVIGAA